LLPYGRVESVEIHSAKRGMLAMKPGTEASDPRLCLQCGKRIVHRRVTALYCSGKCREIHNAQKRRQIRQDAKEAPPGISQPELNTPFRDTEGESERR